MKVSKEFRINFAEVCKHYECQPNEVEEMKAAVRRDYDAAEVCFAAMAKEIHQVAVEV